MTRDIRKGEELLSYYPNFRNSKGGMEGTGWGGRGKGNRVGSGSENVHGADGGLERGDAGRSIKDEEESDDEDDEWVR